MKEKILCVDDDPNILAGFQRCLRKDFAVETCPGGAQALQLLSSQGPFAVIVADMQMPVMNGVEFLTLARQRAPDSVRIMLTGNADQNTAIEAVNQGHIFRFLNKPCPPEKLAQTLAAGVQQYRLITAERDLLERTLGGSVKVLSEILSLQDPKIFGRSQRLRDELRAFLKFFNADETWAFEVAALLSHIGWVTIPVEVVHKVHAGLALSGAERDMLVRVPDIGASLLANIPRLELVANIVRYQGKHYDGNGYPHESLAGESIPVGARILKVLNDLLDLEIGGCTRATALLAMQKKAGWYDPRVLDAAFACFDVYLPQSTSTQKSIRSILVGDLQAGHVLAADIQTMDGMLILVAGSQISPAMVEKIRNFAILNGIQEPIKIEA